MQRLTAAMMALGLGVVCSAGDGASVIEPSARLLQRRMAGRVMLGMRHCCSRFATSIRIRMNLLPTTRVR